MTPRPHEPCPDCGRPAYTPHNDGCPWLRFIPDSWRVPLSLMVPSREKAEGLAASYRASRQLMEGKGS